MRRSVMGAFWGLYLPDLWSLRRRTLLREARLFNLPIYERAYLDLLFAMWIWPVYREKLHTNVVWTIYLLTQHWSLEWNLHKDCDGVFFLLLFVRPHLKLIIHVLFNSWLRFPRRRYRFACFEIIEELVWSPVRTYDVSVLSSVHQKTPLLHSLNWPHPRWLAGCAHRVPKTRELNALQGYSLVVLTSHDLQSSFVRKPLPSSWKSVPCKAQLVWAPPVHVGSPPACAVQCHLLIRTEPRLVRIQIMSLLASRE